MSAVVDRGGDQYRGDTTARQDSLQPCVSPALSAVAGIGQVTAREKESHGLLPLYVALVTKAPAEVALAVLEAYPKLLLNGKWQDISARGARSLRRFPPVAA